VATEQFRGTPHLITGERARHRHGGVCRSRGPCCFWVPGSRNGLEWGGGGNEGSGFVEAMPLERAAPFGRAAKLDFSVTPFLRNDNPYFRLGIGGHRFQPPLLNPPVGCRVRESNRPIAVARDSGDAVIPVRSGGGFNDPREWIGDPRAIRSVWLYPPFPTSCPIRAVHR